MLEWNRCHMSTWTTSHTFYVHTINQPESCEALWSLKNKSLRKTKQIPMFTLDAEASLWSHWNDGYVHRCVKRVQSDQWEPHRASRKINTSRSSDRLRRRQIALELWISYSMCVRIGRIYLFILYIYLFNKTTKGILSYSSSCICWAPSAICWMRSLAHEETQTFHILPR